MTKDDAAKAVREKFKASTEGEGDAYTHGWFDGRDAASAEPVNAPQKPNGQRIIDGLKDAVAYANGDNSKGTSETFNAPQQVTTECDHGFIPYKGEMVCDKCGKYNYQVALPQNAEMIEALLKYPAVFKYDEMPKEFAELLKLARIKNRQIIAEAIATERGHVARMREALEYALECVTCKVPRKCMTEEKAFYEQALAASPPVEQGKVVLPESWVAVRKDVRGADIEFAALDGYRGDKFADIITNIELYIAAQPPCPFVEQESAWLDVRRAALEEAAAINIDGYETPFEPNEDINLGVAGGIKIYRDAVLELIDTPPKPDISKAVTGCGCGKKSCPKCYQQFTTQPIPPKPEGAK